MEPMRSGTVLRAPVSGKYYIAYHRRPLGETDRNHRVVCNR